MQRSWATSTAPDPHRKGFPHAGPPTRVPSRTRHRRGPGARPAPDPGAQPFGDDLSHFCGAHGLIRFRPFGMAERRAWSEPIIHVGFCSSIIRSASSLLDCRVNSRCSPSGFSCPDIHGAQPFAIPGASATVCCSLDTPSLAKHFVEGRLGPLSDCPNASACNNHVNTRLL